MTSIFCSHYGSATLSILTATHVGSPVNRLWPGQKRAGPGLLCVLWASPGPGDFRKDWPPVPISGARWELPAPSKRAPGALLSPTACQCRASPIPGADFLVSKKKLEMVFEALAIARRFVNFGERKTHTHTHTQLSRARKKHWAANWKAQLSSWAHDQNFSKRRAGLSPLRARPRD